MPVSATISYQYADGSANTIRRTGITYPNGREVGFLYNAPVDTQLRRVSAIADGTLRSGLVSYWTLNAKVSGTQIFPDSADGNPLTDTLSNVGSATGVSTSMGNAAQFTSSSHSQIDLYPAPGLGFGPRSFSTAGWVRFDNVIESPGLWGKGNSGNGAYTQQEWVLAIIGGYLYWILSDGNTFNVLNSGVQPVVNTWYYVAA